MPCWRSAAERSTRPLAAASPADSGAGLRPARLSGGARGGCHGALPGAGRGNPPRLRPCSGRDQGITLTAATTSAPTLKEVRIIHTFSLSRSAFVDMCSSFSSTRARQAIQSPLKRGPWVAATGVGDAVVSWVVMSCRCSLIDRDVSIRKRPGKGARRQGPRVRATGKVGDSIAEPGRRRNRHPADTSGRDPARGRRDRQEGNVERIQRPRHVARLTSPFPCGFFPVHTRERGLIPDAETGRG